jgi:hypothetical protein
MLMILVHVAHVNYTVGNQMLVICIMYILYIMWICFSVVDLIINVVTSIEWSDSS